MTRSMTTGAWWASPEFVPKQLRRLDSATIRDAGVTILTLLKVVTAPKSCSPQSFLQWQDYFLLDGIGNRVDDHHDCLPPAVTMPKAVPKGGYGEVGKAIGGSKTLDPSQSRSWDLSAPAPSLSRRTSLCPRNRGKSTSPLSTNALIALQLAVLVPLPFIHSISKLETAAMLTDLHPSLTHIHLLSGHVPGRIVRLRETNN